MPTYRLAKVNERDLTPAEEAEIAAYWPANPDTTLEDLITHFEVEFKTPVTQTRVIRIMIEHARNE